MSISKLGGGRVAYLDTLRGFTMLLVIWHHVSDYAFGLKIEDSFLSEVMIAFRMPMFFFISGFIAYKAIEWWNINNFITRLRKKAMVQLVPTVVFAFMGALLLGNVKIAGLGVFFRDSFPGFWWFTVALFVMFCMYYISSIIAHYVKKWMLFPLLLLCVIVLMAFKSHFQEPGFFQWLAFPGVARFFVFFVFGLFCRSFESKFFKAIENKYVITLSIIIVAVLVYLSYGAGYTISHDFMAIIRTAVGFPFILVVFTLFYKQQEYWANNTRLSRLMRFIGRRTLDLYMLHFFFIPYMPYLNEYLVGTNQTVIQLIVIGIITVGVTFMCLVVSMVLRSSPILSEYLFGQSGKAKNILQAK